ncbi:hypothetical protein T265_08045 [Opisthorchis viverrini]|uniref:Uncharacterized protein n=1 Tax=Opisthorchis viverrini TaxID=6198 RepID=A0A074ZAW1_OPIVI|nr:hypothetical protein T265_08045 [Opisthorchis viverrini]KER24253.1 hypothetical protein T265_08045 [Opisthorchis viverrini]
MELKSEQRTPECFVRGKPQGTNEEDDRNGLGWAGIVFTDSNTNYIPENSRNKSDAVRIGVRANGTVDFFTVHFLWASFSTRVSKCRPARDPSWSAYLNALIDLRGASDSPDKHKKC